MHKTAVIVEDDPDIRHLIVEVLEAAGFSTVSVGNGIDGVRAVLSYQPLITTLDVNMPGIDGFEAARRIRAQSDTYIIMITGLEEEADVVLGLGAGADEYVVKPFRPRELRARVESLLRRPRATGSAAATAPRQDAAGPSFPGARPAAAPQPDLAPTSPVFDERVQTPVYPQQPEPQQAPPQQQPYQGGSAVVVPQSAGPQFGGPPAGYQPGNAAAPASATPPVGGPGWSVHRDLAVHGEHRVVLVGGRELTLTRTEFDLLSTLMESKRRVRSKADLTLVLRGESYVTSYFVGEADKRAIEAHMTNLRRKLGDNPNNPRYIETVRGVGYRLTSETGATA
ncbi:response regulator transcription factor [Microbacterium sp. EYE_5]|uniref:response regulator transcription factor n=1 Tax=unclassified Microbacterium TaxID=2609290 RepID=UPI0020054AC4|nr:MULTISPECIES: response regulator transcription factor [unclassified Microbacterium]MCK6079066.1 response regulator transcription factor [Microbacterium sp. EYE_382]MCK6084336.1 response regulator transcription factor [Microbacterium sp. EYE_384]MCK6123435.1 response regulator transcription factor [Microbacterium sp. EYE_80]MCK6125100.1 response regulator transcription factor [Microbacterium sp. EYE_79]MCK6140020.1 response regulator transcription factor [Microbacterium sp. EYE_39]